MKTIKIIIILILLCTKMSIAQWCGQPNPNFCPGNFFQNGDFENLTGNPGASPDNDINLAVGWQALWNGANNGSLADLACGGVVQTATPWFTNPPNPNTGAYAGMWIQNTTSRTTIVTYREGMYNRLNTPIGWNSGSYSFNFDIAKGMNANAPNQAVMIGVYGVFNAGNIVANAPISLYNPLNINLWAASPGVQVVYLGTVTAPLTLNQTWQTQNVTFNSNVLPNTGITHIMLASDDAVVTSNRRMYVNFDNFCMQKAPPPLSVCCQDSLDIWNATGTPDPLPVRQVNSYGQKVSIASEDFVIHRDAKYPVMELRVAVTDIDFEYNYEACADCKDNPALWGSLFSTTNAIGTTPNNLNLERLPYQSNSPSSPIPHKENWREIIWSNPTGAMLKNGDRFNVSYILPPASEIPCCVTSVKICTEISWKDANCNMCSIETCSNINLGKDSTIPGTSQIDIKVENEGCCDRRLTAIANGATAYSWSNGASSNSTVISKNGTYSVTATVGGSPVSTSITVSDIMSGDFPLLSFNSRFHPDLVRPYKEKFYIMDLSPGKWTEGTPNCYNANEYKLEIWHRWNTNGGQGNPLKVITGMSSQCSGFDNWDIAWDGTDQNGVSLKNDKADSYVWRLTLKNCSKESSRLTYRTTFKPKCDCEEYAYLFPRRKKVRLWCKKWNGCWRTETFEYGDVQMTM